jgi:hypothetical protein
VSIVKLEEVKRRARLAQKAVKRLAEALEMTDEQAEKSVEKRRMSSAWMRDYFRRGHAPRVEKVEKKEAA